MCGSYSSGHRLITYVLYDLKNNLVPGLLFLDSYSKLLWIMHWLLCQAVSGDDLDFHVCSSDIIYILKYLNFNFRYIVFFCPRDLVSQGYSYQPIQLLAAGMKEVTRTWKIVGGVTHANNYYRNGWIVMIVVGWARGKINNLCSHVLCHEYLSAYRDRDHILY